MACLHHHSERLLGDVERAFAEPGVEPNFAPSRTTRIAHLDVTLDLFPEERRFQGEARVRVEPLPHFLGTVELDLDEVEVTAVTDEAGEPLAFSHDDAVLRVRDVEAPLTVVVRWKGSDPRLGLYFTGPAPFAPERQHMAWTQCQDEDGHFVLPCHDHPQAKHPWSIRLTGPAGHTLLSNGRQTGSGQENGRAWATFVQAEPMPAYLFTAVCARLSVVETAWRDTPVRYLVPVGEEEAVERAMGRTPEMIELFSRLTGVPYPWPRYDQVVVHDFVFGGMENIACTTMTEALLVDAKAAVEYDPDGLVAHELAHQWFGDLVTCQDWSQGWLNESWATFSEVLWWEHAKGAADAAWYRFGLARDYFEEDGKRYRRPIVSYRFREPIDVFDRHLYQKGACVLVTLRATLGEDAFWTGVRTYLERHAHQTVHSRHFQRALEDATGKNLDRFFQEWIHGAGHPVLEVRLREEEGLLAVTVKQTQSGDGTAEAFAFPLRLEVDGRTVDLPVRERERTWALPVDGPVGKVRVDPGFRVLAELKLDAPRGLLVGLLDDPCPVLASRAARALLEEGSEPAFRAVVAALSAHADHHVREDLARKVAESGGAGARDALLGALRTERHPRVRRALAEALGGFREAAVAEVLIGLLDAPETWHLQGAALESLGRTRDPRAPQVIADHLDVESWFDQVRRKALSGLAATRDPAVLDTLVAYSRARWPERVRGTAAEALGSLGDDVPDVRDAVCERLVEMLDEPGFRSQVGAISGLKKLRHEKALPALDRIHRTATDGRARRLAYEAARATRRGRSTEEGLQSLRAQLEKLQEKNHALEQRLRKLESRLP